MIVSVVALPVIAIVPSVDTVRVSLLESATTDVPFAANVTKPSCTAPLALSNAGPTIELAYVLLAAPTVTAYALEPEHIEYAKWLAAKA